MKKGLSDYSNWITIAAFMLMLLGFGAKAVLLSDQVGRNTEAINEANLKVMIYQLKQIEEKVDKIYDLLLEQ